MALGPVEMDEADDEDDDDNETDDVAEEGRLDMGADTTASAEAASVSRDDARGTNVCSIGTAATAGFLLAAVLVDEAADKSVLAISSSSSNA